MQSGQWNGRRRRTRFQRFRWGRGALLIVSAALMIFGLVKLAGYGADMISARQTAAVLREAYQQSTEQPPAETPGPSPVPATPVPTAVQASAVPTAAPATPTPVRKLGTIVYPRNPKLQVSSRFKALRKKNKDITGWLTICDLLDEAVVQRDEVFYMDHDALGQQNVNGAIFLDSGISLKTRPYTLILYGHNMKSGAMFGSLRNFENASFYHKNPFITFDTVYEEGRYVIFAVGNINTEPNTRNYVDFFALRSTDIRERQTAIDILKACSVHTCTVDVQPDDQLLILVTCVEKNEERRVVAARRIRDGENEPELKKQAKRSRKRY